MECTVPISFTTQEDDCHGPAGERGDCPVASPPSAEKTRVQQRASLGYPIQSVSMRTGRESNHIKTTGVQDLCSLGLQLTTLNEFCYHQVLRVFIRLRALQLGILNRLDVC